MILVEGESDREAVVTLAEKQGIDLVESEVEIVAMGGASRMGETLTSMLTMYGVELTLGGLYDQGEIDDVIRGLQQIGSGPNLTQADLEAMGFYGCEADLEEELIRALGAGGVEAVIAEQGELRSFRSLQNQPAWRGRPVEHQLRRFFGSQSGRKLRYARLLVEALELERMPPPLLRVLAYVTS